MTTLRRGLRLLLAFACAFTAAEGWAQASCRTAFDLGSSGIRAGSTPGDRVARADLDALGTLTGGGSLAAITAPTIRALLELPERGGFPQDCARVAGGFSAWRLALARDRVALARVLADIADASGVPVLVLPQTAEGAYTYLGARVALGERLVTSHVLDLGGGSLQLAGADGAHGAALGQRLWHAELCHLLRGPANDACDLQPASEEDLRRARTALADRLAPLSAALRRPVTLTAVSRPVVRGVIPAVRRLESGSSPDAMPLDALSASIGRIAAWSLEDTATRVEAPVRFARYLLSDMLLVEGVLRATGADALHAADLVLTNVPGLLADDRAFAWAARYGCYLERLRALGEDAYASDPATCSAPSGGR